jgi:DNA polymerase-4
MDCDRVILHCDCNSFFASVETALNPNYKNVPMAVCGSVEDRHGIVLAKNELAKKYGIKTAETVYSAKRKCKNLVIAKPHYDEYSRFSERVNKIYARYTDLIEPFGIDESWLDVTASVRHFGSGVEIAEKIRQAVKDEIGITVSIGVSFSKVFAKLGSDYKKPDAITVISRENFREIAYPLPVSDMIFVGNKTAEALKKMGIHTIGDLALSNPQFLKTKLGKAGEHIYLAASGLDSTPVTPPLSDTTKSISNGFTFRHNLLGRHEWRIGIDYLAQELGAKLRKHRQKCATVAISIKDEHLKTIQRQRAQNPPTDISREIANTAYDLLCDEWSDGVPIRMITVTVANLISQEGISEQLDFFGNENSEIREKGKKIENAVDKIRQKFGGEAIVHGAIIDSDIGIYDKRKTKK